MGLSLALHELATNAAKYGALSGDSGIVEIEWSLRETGEFSFRWSETGGPPVVVPEKTGFGTQLIRRMVAPYFNGDVKLEYEPLGFRFSLEGRLPLES
ncbi:hypothetical protein [Rhizobium sp. Rhizsp42]